MSARILIVDDDQSLCEMIEDDLRRHGFDPAWHTSADEAFSTLMKRDFDVLLTDLYLPGLNGIEFCERVVANWPDVPVIVMTAFGSLDTAVAAIRAGAYDFVTKPVDGDILRLSLQRAVKHRSLQNQVKRLSEALDRSQQFGELIGTSTRMRDLRTSLARIADTDTSILIIGESGTGKELVARSLHKQSHRREGPFVPINCAAIPETLLESELFGHERGAFTDAKAARKGLFVQAEGGTLFFDEIGELPMVLQPKILRAIEERRVRPVGGESEVAFDVRIIAATNRDLETDVDEGRFRKDLFFRINVIQVNVPPLRSRGTDPLLLAQQFLEEFAAASGRAVTGISDAAAERLLSYEWPGNVRELRNAIERAVALTRYEKLIVEDLPERLRAYSSDSLVLGSNDPGELSSLEEMERRYILHVLKASGGNRTLAARVLGLDRKTLYRKLKSYEEA